MKAVKAKKDSKLHDLASDSDTTAKKRKLIMRKTFSSDENDIVDETNNKLKLPPIIKKGKLH